MLYNLSKSSDTITLSLKGSQTTLKHIIENLRDGRYTLEIKQVRQLRTISQNHYYFASLNLVAQEVGYISPEMSKEQISEIVIALHETLKERFIGTKTLRSSKDKRRRIKIRPTTTNMDTKEFSAYFEKIRTLFPFIPDPTDPNLLTFIDTYYPL